MATLRILTWPSQILETKAESVTLFDDKLELFVKDMHETMVKGRGIGLAANQVGSLQRVITILIKKEEGEPEKSWHGTPLTFINPVITARSDEMISSQEGCLSLPGVYEFIDRHEKITIEAANEKGEIFTMEADDILSICLQHEIDHLDGITFLKRMSRLKSKMAKKKLTKNRQGSYIPA